MIQSSSLKMFEKEQLIFKLWISEKEFNKILSKHWNEIQKSLNRNWKEIYSLISFQNIISKYTENRKIEYIMKFNVCTWILRERFIKFLIAYKDSYNHFMKRKFSNDHFTYKDVEIFTWFNTEISKQLNTEVIWNFVKTKKWHTEKLWTTFSKSKSFENYDKYLKRERLEYEVKWFSKNKSTICLDHWKLFILWFELDLKEWFMIENEIILKTSLKDKQEFLLKYNKNYDDLYLVMKVEKQYFNTKKLFS